MKAKDLDKIFDDGEVDINDYLDLSSANKPNKDKVKMNGYNNEKRSCDTLVRIPLYVERRNN